MIHPCKFSEIQSIGSRDFVGTRSGTPMPTQMPTGSALNPMCPPHLWLGGLKSNNDKNNSMLMKQEMK